MLRLPGLLALALTLSAQTLPPGVRLKTSLAGISEYEFPNGLRVLLYPDSGSTKITVNMTYLVGSRHEGYGESGMAHLLEHLLFIETANGRKIKKELVDRGTQWNGTTWFDWTNYFETFSASDDNLTWALGLEADRMVNTRLEKPLLDVEMSVVRNEFERGENDVRGVLDDRVMATAFLWHNYGKSTIGSRADIERVPIERLRAFYKKYYRPDNAVLAIGGKVDAPATLAAVAASLGKIPRPATPVEKTYTQEPPQDGERFVELRRTGNGQELNVSYHAPSASHTDTAALKVMAGIMGSSSRFAGGVQGRLQKALVDNKKALTASMSFIGLHDPGAVTFTASLNKTQSLDDVKRVLYETIEGVVKEPPTQEELDRSRNRLLRNMERTLADSAQLTRSLTGPISQGDWRLLFWDHEQIKKVTAEDVVRVARTYFKPSNRTVGVFIPTGEPDRTVVTEAAPFDQIFKDFTTTAKVSQGEAFEPTPANIESRVVRKKLPGGLSVLFLPKQTAGGRITALLDLRYGDEKSLSGRKAAASMMGSLLMRGTRNRTRQQLQDAIDKLDARVSASAGLYSMGATIDAKPEKFLDALRLAVEILREPAFPENDFEQIKARQLNGIEAQRTDPRALASLVMNRAVSPFPKGHPRYEPQLEEELEEWKALTLDSVKQFYAQFAGASTGEFAAAGPVDQAAIESELAARLGDWKSASPYTVMPSPYKKGAAANVKLETPDKENAQFLAGMRIRLNDQDPDYPAMMLANHIFGGTISSRMPDRIRNREGLSYGAGSRLLRPIAGDGALFSASVTCNPANAPKVEASFLDELAKSVRDGFTQAELDASRKVLLESLRSGRTQDGALVAALQSRQEQGRTMQWDIAYEKRLSELTLQQLNAAWRKHMDPAALTIVKAGDFKKAGVWQ